MPWRVLMAAATALALLMVRLGPARHNVPSAALAFSPNKPFATRPHSCSVVALNMGRKKGSGGRLGNMVDVDMLESSSSSSAAAAPAPAKKPTTSKGKRSGTRREKTAVTSSTKTAAAGGISPLLAQWAADKTPAKSGDDEEGNEAVLLPPPPTRDALDSSRRQRQSQRKELEKERDEVVQQTVESIEAMLSDDDDDADGDNNSNDNKKKKKEPFKVEALLARIRELLELTSSSAVGSSSNNNNLRQLSAGSGTTDYRLAWVGSDEAMCHLGTGLHKVTLARLQEVFLTLGPKSRVQMYEVIRILGPFPNVRNTLVGKSAVDKPRGAQATTAVQPWRITWQSLIDGTGKEILSGSQVRNVDMEVLWCDASLLLCAAKFADTASTEGTNEDLLHDDGRDLFVFVREAKMESKLDALRVI
jgi:vacuolar-type H+-ATPase subunit H